MNIIAYGLNAYACLSCSFCYRCTPIANNMLNGACPALLCAYPSSAKSEEMAVTLPISNFAMKKYKKTHVKFCRMKNMY